MNKDSKTKQQVDTRGRRSWTAPTLTRIDAGEAEVFTRNGSDGQFTTS